MTLNAKAIEEAIGEAMRSVVRVHCRPDGVLMLDTPFTFPDGDHYPIYVSMEQDGSIVLGDRGHTLMHISYEHDVDALFDGTRAALREQIVSDFDVQEENGAFSVRARLEGIAEAAFRLGQALTRIYDLTFLSRERSESTFYEDFHGMLISLFDETRLQKDHVLPDVPEGHNYPIDYQLDGREGRQIFVFGVSGRDKARLTTISLSHFLLNDVEFESLIVYRDLQNIPRLDLARLTNVAGAAVSSLEAEPDFRRKLLRLVA